MASSVPSLAQKENCNKRERDVVELSSDPSSPTKRFRSQSSLSEDAFRSPAPKHAPTALKAFSQSISQGEASTCPVCLEKWTSTGAHRIVALKCGHLFGKECILKWIKQSKSCVTCKADAKPSDVRHLFVPVISAMDIDEKARLSAELVQERTRRIQVQGSYEELLLQYKILQQKYQKLQAKSATSTVEAHAHWQSPLRAAAPLAPPPRSLDSNMNPDGFFPSRLEKGSISSTSLPSSATLTLEHSIAITDGRCVAYSPFDQAYFVSCKASDFGRRCGIRIVSALDITGFAPLLQVHEDRVNCLVGSPEGSTVLSCSSDRTLMVSDIRTRNSVVSLNAEYQLWSCEWHKSDSNIVFGGLSNGQLLLFDLRKPQGPLLAPLKIDRQALHSICFVSGHEENYGVITGSFQGLSLFTSQSNFVPRNVGPRGTCLSAARSCNGDALVCSFKQTEGLQRSSYHVYDWKIDREGELAQSEEVVFTQATVNTKQTRSAVLLTAKNTLVASTDVTNNCVNVWGTRSEQPIAAVPNCLGMDYAWAMYGERNIVACLTNNTLSLYSLTL